MFALFTSWKFVTIFKIEEFQIKIQEVMHQQTFSKWIKIYLLWHKSGGHCNLLEVKQLDIILVVNNWKIS